MLCEPVTYDADADATYFFGSIALAGVVRLYQFAYCVPQPGLVATPGAMRGSVTNVLDDRGRPSDGMMSALVATKFARSPRTPVVGVPTPSGTARPRSSSHRAGNCRADAAGRGR